MFVYSKNCLNLVVFYLFILDNGFGFLVNLEGILFLRYIKFVDICSMLCDFNLY